MASAYFPTITVSLNPTAAPLDTASTGWVDITPYVVGDLQLVRGMSGTIREHQPGTLRLTLINDTRRFDPTNSSSPYFPNLRPRNRIRVTVSIPSTSSGTQNITLFEGYVRSWPQIYSPPDESFVELDVDDPLALLARTPTPDSWFAYQMSQLSTPRAWYRLDDPAGQSVAFDSSGNNRHGTYYATNPANAVVSPYVSQYKGTSVVPFGSKSSLDLKACIDRNSPLNDGSTMWNICAQVLVPTTATPSGTSYTVAMWVRLTQDQDRNAVISNAVQMLWTIGSGVNAEYVSVQGDGRITGYVRSTQVIAAGTNLYDGREHLVALTRTSTTWRLYIDGTQVATASGSFPAVTNTDPFWLCSSPDNVGNAGLRTYGQVGEVAIWGTQLSAANITALYTAGATSLAGQTPAQRIGSVLDVIGWPAGDRSIDTTASGVTLQAWRPSGTALDELRRAAAADGGQVWATPGRVIRHTNRTNTYTGALTAKPTFSDLATDPDATVTRYTALELDPIAEAKFATTVTVKWVGGEAVVSQATSLYAQASLDVDTDLRTYADAVQLATDLATVGSSLLPVARMSLGPITPDDFWAACLLGPGANITLKRWPQSIGSVITSTMMVEQVAHRISDGVSWETVVDLVGTATITGINAYAPVVTIQSARSGTTGQLLQESFNVSANPAPTSVTVSPSTGTATITGSYPTYVLNIASVASGVTNYTITATNSAGSGTGAIAVTGSAAVLPPTVSAMSPTSGTGPTGQPINTNFSVTNLGGGTVSVSPSTFAPTITPIGGGFYTLSITPTAAGNYTYTVTATNSAGSDSEPFSVTVWAAFTLGASTLGGPDLLG